MIEIAKYWVAQKNKKTEKFRFPPPFHFWKTNLYCGYSLSN